MSLQDDDEARMVRITEDEETLEAFDLRFTDTVKVSIYQQPSDLIDDDDEYIVDEGEENSEDGDGVPMVVELPYPRPSEPAFPPPPQPAISRISVNLSSPAPTVPVVQVVQQPQQQLSSSQQQQRTTSKTYEMNPFADDDDLPETVSSLRIAAVNDKPSPDIVVISSENIPPPPAATPPLPPPPKMTPPAPRINKSTSNDNQMTTSEKQQTIPTPQVDTDNSNTTIKNGVVTITRTTARSRSTASSTNSDPRLRAASTSGGSMRIQTTKCGYIIPPPFKGMMQKLSSSSFGTWHDRFFQLERGALVYFEPIHWYLCGQIDLVGLKVVGQDEGLMIKLVPGLPEQQGKRPDCIMQAESIDSKVKWISILEEHIAFAEYVHTQMQKELQEQQANPEQPIHSEENVRNVNTKSVVQRTADAPPPINHGWLFKKGQIFPTIKKRYFLLNEGTLAYFKQDLSKDLEAMVAGEVSVESEHTNRTAQIPKTAEAQLRRLPKPLGKFSVYDYQIYSDHSDGRIELLLVPGTKSKSSRKLYIYCENYIDREQWISALNAHAAYSPL